MESDEPREVQDPEEEQGDRVGDGRVSQVRFTGWDLPKRHKNSHLYESSPGEILWLRSLQQEAMVAVMDSDMHNSPDGLPGSPLPAEEQLTVSSHPSCTHGGSHM